MAVSADELVTEKARPLLHLARSACVDEMRGHEQQQALNMGTAFTLAPDKLEALLLPVTDMTPPRPCTTASYAGRSRHGPVCPNPEIEQ